MPKKLEKALTRGAKKKGLKGKDKKAYIYGTMEELGFLPRKKKK